MTKEKNHKKSIAGTLLLIGAVIAAALCLIPIPSRIKDGGSLYLQPVIPVYSITRWNGYGRDEYSRTAGITLKIAGIEVYSSFHEESRKQN